MPKKRKESEVQSMKVCESSSVETEMKEIVMISNDSGKKNIKSDVTSKCDKSNEPKLEYTQSSDAQKSAETKPTKKKVMRRMRKLHKIMQREKCDENKAREIMKHEFEKKMRVKSLEDYIKEAENFKESKHKLEVYLQAFNNYIKCLLT